MRVAPGAVLVLLLGLVGCGGGSKEPAQTVSTPTTADAPAKLPRRWSSHVNGPGGFSVGVPPAWTAKLNGSTSELTAPGRLLAVSIAADRTNEALAAVPAAFAEQTAKNLTGFRGLRPARARALPTQYPGAILQTEGKRANGKRERLTLVVLKPDSIAVFSLLAASTGKLKARAELHVIAQITRSLRYRPVEG